VNYVQVAIQCLHYLGDLCTNSLDCLHHCPVISVWYPDVLMFTVTG